MAEYRGDLKIEGSIGDFSIVKRKDLGKYYVRKKGGPSKKQIAQLPSMKGTREINAEFGGCSKAGTAIRMATNAVRHLSDYNISAPLNAIAKVIQTTDKKGTRGQRAIDISTNKDMLPGFSFNRQKLTDSVLRTPVVANVSRPKKTAEVTIPRIIPDVNLKQYGNNTMFRFIVSLGVVSDLQYNVKHKKYEPIHSQLHSQCFYNSTPWYSIKSSIDQQTIPIAIDSTEDLLETDTLIVAFGIEFGTPLSDSLVIPTEHAGCAKIIATD